VLRLCQCVFLVPRLCVRSLERKRSAARHVCRVSCCTSPHQTAGIDVVPVVPPVLVVSMVPVKLPIIMADSWDTLKSGMLATTEGLRPILTVAFSNLRAASLVCVVSLVLSIGLGISSGSDPVAGLRTAMWGGMMMAAAGSSPFNIIGPTGALSGLLTTSSTKWGPDILPWIAIFSGVICVITAALGLTKYLLFLPKSVFEGFTISVALTVGFKQLNFAFGLTGTITNQSFGVNTYDSLVHLHQAHWGSMVLFFPLSLALMLLLKYVPKVPWMVVLPLGTILFGYFFTDSPAWKLPTLMSKYGQLPGLVVVTPNSDALTKCDDVFGLILASFSVGFVAVLETLISAKISEQKATVNARGAFNDKHEIYALSATKLLVGLFGGLPCSGVFVRTNLNMMSGATHQLSQFMNAVMVLIVTAVAMPVFSYVTGCDVIIICVFKMESQAVSMRIRLVNYGLRTIGCYARLCF
jgi:SulP family sulfate permease